MAMKVRFGFTCRGQADLALDDFPRLVEDLERLGFDSLWLPERMLNGPFDPLVGLAHAAARTARLKLGAYVIVPGRNPVRLARALANLDRLSGGRLLLIMVLGQPDASEVLAQDVTKAERGALLEEVLPLLRRSAANGAPHGLDGRTGDPGRRHPGAPDMTPPPSPSTSAWRWPWPCG
jgi:alkanesulfonate monooxygenase SsuD/methylene tetrahydromethanopterin reductase-like flavin-dependent oxidoreductase (luciferase family)